jgi:dipeptide transport system substrate-binding protein
MKMSTIRKGILSCVVLAAPAFGAEGKTLVYCTEGSPKAFNPQIATDGTTYNHTRHIYNKLVEFENGKTTIIPGLAESWEASKDGLTYTFKLRKDVSFHTTPYFKPTRKFNADDVLFSFNRQKDKNHPYYAVNGGSYEYFSSMEMPSLIKNIVKVDDYTVKIELTRQEAPFLADLAMDFASILSAEYGDVLLKKKTPTKIDWEPIGTGPFVFQKYAKDQMVRYEANKDYFRGAPKISKLVFAITTDPSVRFQKLKTNECQFAAEPAPQDLAAMKQNPKLLVLEQEGLNVGYLALNTRKKPLDNPVVRQAISYALNRPAYISAIYLGNAAVAKNPIPPTMWSYNNAIKDYEYNPEKAKELLKKAGLEKGLTLELWTLPVSRPYNPNGKKMGELMQADLAKVGIQVKLVTYDWPTYLEKSKKGEHDLIQFGWTGDNGDPDNFLAVLLGCAGVEAGSNTSFWCNKDFEAKIQAAKKTTQFATREKLYMEAQQIFKDQAPWVPLAHSKVYRAMSKDVTGYNIDPFGGDSFERVELR